MLLRMAMLLSYGATTAEWHRLSETRTAARRMIAAVSPDERRGGGRAPPTTATPTSVAQQQQTVVEVATQAELIAAIGSNVTISLTGNIILSDSTYIASSDTGIVINSTVKGLVINGNGFSIDGGDRMRCIYIGDGAEVKIKSLAVTRGRSTSVRSIFRLSCVFDVALTD